MEQKKTFTSYRVNHVPGSERIMSVEVTCCGSRIGEIRFRDGESMVCPCCGKSHAIRVQHNHFHIEKS